ncbi:MAG: acyltransferase [Coprococcus sp.]
MELLTSFNDIESEVKQNKVYANPQKSSLENSKITFRGTGNILFVEDGVRLSNCTIGFQGSNSVVYLSKNRHIYYLNISINNNSCVYIGEDCYFNGKMTIVASEQQNILIGNDGLFSFGIFIRTADPHLVYDCNTKKRINDSRSVLIGDHVWLGQNALILKGTAIGSGAIIGGNAVLSNKTIPSNVSAAGNPSRIIKSGVFFSSECVHAWTDEMTEKYEYMDTDKYIYDVSCDTVDMKTIDAELKAASTGSDRLEITKKLLADNTAKNRFAMNGK